MRVLLLYFSGTGNTSRCAKKIMEAFEKNGQEVIRYECREDSPFEMDVSSFDMLGIGYPIHAFNVPEAFNRFLKTLPPLEKDYFIFKVSGEPFHLNDASSHHFAKRLKKKGYRLIAEKHFLMPYNIIFRYKDPLAKQMALYLGPLTEAFVLGILEGKGERIKYRFDRKAVSLLLRIEWIAPKLNAPFIHMKRKKCVKCSLCLKECPTGAISIDKKGKYRVSSSKCAMCMRCAYSCPKDAILFGFMNPWKVNGPYQYEKLMADESIDPRFVKKGRKGYFRLFLPYFKRQDALLEEYGIPNPMGEYLQESLPEDLK